MREGGAPEWKINAVKDMTNLVKEYSVVCVVNLEGLPSKQLLKMKQSLREEAVIKMSKKSILKRALAAAKVEKLNEHLSGQPALLLSKTNPFKLSKKIQDSKMSAPAKEGNTMPKDIIVPAGETTFMPGPIVGELGKAGIAAAIENGKVVIKKESTVAKEGEKINKMQADAMAKLGIEPMEIGLNLVAAYEDGFLYTSDVLAINTEQVLGNMQLAYTSAFNLAFNITYPTNDNIEMFIAKAFREAKGLATEAGFVCSATVKELLGKASLQANSLKANLPDAPVEKKEEEAATEREAPKEKPEEKKEETMAEEKKREESPAEEKKEEAPAEEKKEEKAEKKVEEKATEEAKQEEAPKEEDKEEKKE